MLDVCSAYTKLAEGRGEDAVQPEGEERRGAEDRVAREQARRSHDQLQCDSLTKRAHQERYRPLGKTKSLIALLVIDGTTVTAVKSRCNDISWQPQLLRLKQTFSY